MSRPQGMECKVTAIKIVIIQDGYNMVGGQKFDQKDKPEEPNRVSVNPLLYVQEVVTLQKKIFYIFASENKVYTIY